VVKAATTPWRETGNQGEDFPSVLTSCSSNGIPWKTKAFTIEKQGFERNDDDHDDDDDDDDDDHDDDDDDI